MQQVWSGRPYETHVYSDLDGLTLRELLEKKAEYWKSFDGLIEWLAQTAQEMSKVDEEIYRRFNTPYKKGDYNLWR